MPATLGYEASNSLINYPFLDNVDVVASPMIPKNCFVDIQFTILSIGTERVYISRVVNDGTNATFYFSDADTSTLIGHIAVPLASAVSHVGNLTASNVNFSNSSFMVKLVFGEGITTLLATTFDTTYSVAETELCAGAIILPHPYLKSLVIKNNYPADTVKTYSTGADVLFAAGSNVDVIDASGLSLAILPRAGTGLHNPCPTGPITDLVSINGIGPNKYGNFFFQTDTCYSQTILNEADLTVYSADLAYYDPFPIPYATNYDARSVGHSIVIQNNCSPKCPPEQLEAFAAYLNRIRDAVGEVYEMVVQPGHTAGTSNTTATATTVTAASFTSTLSGESGFVKYFHEGRDVTITYSPTITQTVTVVEVLSSTTIKVTPALSTTATGASFLVGDEGLYNLLNDAITAYNTRVATTVNVPYGQVISTTSEGLNQTDEYGTFLSVVASVYNPTTATVPFDIVYSPESGLSLVANTLKLRQNDTVTLGVTSGTLACKTYASVEAVFFVNCGTVTKDLDVSINSGMSPVYNGTDTITVTSTVCLPDVGANDTVTAFVGTPFTYDISLGSGTATVVFNESSLPTWADLTTNGNIPPTSGTHNIAGTPDDTVSTTYLVGSTVYNIAGSSSFDLVIKVFVPPVLTVTTLTAGLNAPFIDYVYPTPTSGHLSVTNDPTSYSATGLPTGLSIDPFTGIISGTPTAISSPTVSLTVTNPAGSDTKTFTFNVSDLVPVITSPTSVTFSQGLPAGFQITATNVPTSYSVGSSLPAGLSLDTTTGSISGIPTGSGTSTYTLGATNTAGTGNQSFTLAITAEAPVIVSSSIATGTTGYPFSYTIIASNSPTGYNATGLPGWASIDTSTGIITGTPTAGTTSVTIDATNGVGTTGAPLEITIT
jgi:hypothetical protein